jgi:hypothetical protein
VPVAPVEPLAPVGPVVPPGPVLSPGFLKPPGPLLPAAPLPPLPPGGAAVAGAADVGRSNAGLIYAPLPVAAPTRAFSSRPTILPRPLRGSSSRTMISRGTL